MVMVRFAAAKSIICCWDSVSVPAAGLSLGGETIVSFLRDGRLAGGAWGGSGWRVADALLVLPSWGGDVHFAGLAAL